MLNFLVTSPKEMNESLPNTLKLNVCGKIWIPIQTFEIKSDICKAKSTKITKWFCSNLKM